MNKDMKILVIAIVIIMIGAISFNYMDTTGRVIKSGKTSITVSPKIVEAGQYIYINVYPGKQGVNQKLEFYEADRETRMSGKTARACKDSKCFEKNTVKYKITDDWDSNEKWPYGEVSRDYYVRVYDIYSGKYVRSYFTVERLYEAKGVQEHR